MPRISTAKERLTDAALEMIWENSYGATSVDAICERANVRKGSFYYFFKSKSELAAAALEADWKKHQADLDAIFSPTVPPLERFQRHFEHGYAFMTGIKEKYGAVLGCPVFTLGCEISTLDSVLRDKIQELLNRKLAYLESAIRDAHARGEVDAPDAQSKARAVLAFVEGSLSQARIENSLEPIRQLYAGTLALLGAKPLQLTAV
ncbi:MAG TPA: TetR/AcrR family transcriptional regulator [Chthoniobacterales bacterium]